MIYIKLINKLIISLVLLSILFILLKQNPLLKYSILDDSLSFNTINQYLGKYIVKTAIEPVNNINNTLNYTKYNDGIKVFLSHNQVEAYDSGVVVYLGDINDYNDCIVIQGFNDIDLWYCNLTNYDVTMYEYIKKNTIIGRTNHELILIGKSNGQFYNLEKLMNED